ncbi:uroporphyrinogen decarboxylase [Formicincola oecophyllae]|uniref:Uroporphyrinogen decarboxylase n=1 Tax=Formicincola oecophyllae TaxID=2558361 RepID=A0A4Y6U843_9PROT|nr:uroporphyrinogen decarboxylase [Formicincola oecophyllae]QDH13522.1 uroporphyrinogen decarboxylase [Formicincola oecophyllae]
MKAPSPPCADPANKKLLATLQGKAHWPPPLWLMRQAGRYLPEFKAIRAKADFMTRCLTPDMAVELTLQPIKRYGMDGAILFSDILILPWALGQDLHFEEGRGPVLPPLRHEEDFRALDPARVAERTAPVREAITRLARELATTTTTLLGFAGAPFTVSCYMIEGGGSRDFAAVRRMMIKRPDLYAQLIEMLINATADMLSEQINAGAQAVMLFDSWAGILPPNDFRRWVIEPTRRIRALLKQRHPTVPVIGFPRLGGVMTGEYAQNTGVDTVSLDTSTDPLKILPLLSPHQGVQGNLDPQLLLNGGAPMVKAAQALAETLRGRSHVFNLGHGVSQFTPVEHVAELVEAVRSLSA